MPETLVYTIPFHLMYIYYKHVYICIYMYGNNSGNMKHKIVFQKKHEQEFNHDQSLEADVAQIPTTLSSMQND